MSPVINSVILGELLNLEKVSAVARDFVPVEISQTSETSMAESRAVIEAIVAGGDDAPAVYGVNTGFGALATTRIPPERSAELQQSLVRSHAAGMGPEVETEVVRAMMLLRARTLALAYSGVRPVVAQRLVDLLNHDLIPVVFEHGSLGG